MKIQSLKQTQHYELNMGTNLTKREDKSPFAVSLAPMHFNIEQENKIPLGDEAH